MRQVIKKNIIEANDIDVSPKYSTLIIDGNSLLKMSLVDKRVNSRNEEYGAVLQFFWQMKKRIQERDFNFVYVFWDGDNSGQLRYKYYPEYKANRDKHYRDSEPQSDYERKLQDFYRRTIEFYKKKERKPVKRNETEDESFRRQRSIIQNMLEHLFVRQLMCDDVEGDDLIAFYVKHKDKNDNVVIFSGDRDITQLISDSVSVYVPQLKVMVTPSNHEKVIGFTHENVLVKKILCGDASDNIKGIKGVGETTFFKLFPLAKSKKMTLDDIIEESKRMNEERKANKKKPLAALTNIINSVTDGCQGNRIYEINKKIIDLSEPLLTTEATKEICDMMYAPIDPEGRDYSNLYRIISENDMSELQDENKFSLLFGCFEHVINAEKKFFEKSLK